MGVKSTNPIFDLHLYEQVARDCCATLPLEYFLLHRCSSRSGRLVSVGSNVADRFPIPKLELEVGLYDDWKRYWFRGKLSPLPAELAESLTLTEQKLSTAQAEIARLKTELAMRRLSVN
jgi:hypothetical protein